MTKEEFLQDYTNLCVATSYIIGFVYKDQVYMEKTDKLNSDYMVLDHESSKNNKIQKLRIRFNTTTKLDAIMNGAECIGSADMLKDDTYNKGEMFEKIVSEKFGINWNKDNAPFWLDGDINTNTEKIQVKFDRASIASERTIEMAKRAVG